MCWFVVGGLVLVGLAFLFRWLVTGDKPWTIT